MIKYILLNIIVPPILAIIIIPCNYFTFEVNGLLALWISWPACLSTINVNRAKLIRKIRKNSLLLNAPFFRFVLFASVFKTKTWDPPFFISLKRQKSLHCIVYLHLIATKAFHSMLKNKLQVSSTFLRKPISFSRFEIMLSNHHFSNSLQSARKMADRSL